MENIKFIEFYRFFGNQTYELPLRKVDKICYKKTLEFNNRIRVATSLIALTPVTLISLYTFSKLKI